MKQLSHFWEDTTREKTLNQRSLRWDSAAFALDRRGRALHFAFLLQCGRSRVFFLDSYVVAF